MNNRLFLFFPALLLGVLSADAAAISAVGTDGDTISEWRTSATAKPLDADGDNVYGTDGYALIYQRASGTFTQNFADPLTVAGSPGTLRSDPGYVIATTPTSEITEWNAWSDSYPSLDTPAATGDTIGGLGGSYFETTDQPLVDFEFNATAPAAGVRLGVMARRTGGDALTSLTLTQTAGGTASAQYTSVAGGTEGLATYFFDITGIDAGDTFRLSASNTSGSDHTLYTGLTYDTIPEPSTLLLSLGGLLAAGAFIRRRR